MIQRILDKYRLYKNRKNFKCTLNLKQDNCGCLKHVNFKELSQLLKENEGVQFHNFVPKHIETKEEFNNINHVTVLYKYGKYFFMGPLIYYKPYNDLEGVGFQMRFEIH